MSRRTHPRSSSIAIVIVILAAAFTFLAASPSGAADVTVVRGWVLSADGRVTSIGGAPNHGSIAGLSNRQPAAIVATPSGNGYYVVESHGRVSTFGDARWYGDARDMRLDRPIVDIAVNPTNTGYALLGSDGGVFNYGALRYHGSVPQFVPLAAQRTSAVAIMSSPDGRGYAIVHDDGGVFAFGTATFHGSVPQVLPGQRLASPIVDGFPTDSRRGYWMAGGDGGVFAFDPARFHGSRAGAASFVAGTNVPGNGYALLDSGGGVHWMTTGGYSSAARSAGSASLSSAAVDIAAVGTGTVTVADPPATTQPPPTTQPPAGAVTIFSNYTHAAGPGTYFSPPVPTGVNWSALSTGRATLHLEVLSKPSSKPVLMQVCFWRVHDPYWSSFDETCSSESQTRITDETTVTVDLGVPTSWWKLGGTFPWSSGPTVVRIMIKDEVSKRLMMSSSCGAYCYPGTDLNSHVPITLRGTLTMGN